MTIQDKPGFYGLDDARAIDLPTLFGMQPHLELVKIFQKKLIILFRQKELGMLDNLLIIIFRAGAAFFPHMLIRLGTWQFMIQLAALPLKIYATIGIASLFLQHMINRYDIPEILMRLMGATKDVQSFIVVSDHSTVL